MLFLLVLLLPSVLRRTPDGWQPVERLGDALWPVIGIVTAFTVAHSITLTLAALGWVMLPPAFIEAAIAATIALAAVDNLWPIFGGRRVLVDLRLRPDPRLRLRQRAGRTRAAGARFRLGAVPVQPRLEIGQIAVVLLAVTPLFLARRRAATGRS